MDRRGIYVLRLNHRSQRDKRVTSHLLLAARAFGANGAFYSGERDEKIEKSIKKANETWGGPFELEYVQDWKKTMKQWQQRNGEVIHLTMYGLAAQDVIGQIEKSPKDKLIVVGGAKVPGIVYGLADWNVSITSQPHSEISALSIFLHELHRGKELTKTFEKAKMKIVPQAKGKKVMELNNS